jgi:hypothetical protein
VTTELKNLLPQLPIANSGKSSIKQLPIAAVDKIADELVAEYANPNFRPWYCGVVYEFGFDKVHEWRRRASEGDIPARLFSKYVKEARSFRGSRNV